MLASSAGDASVQFVELLDHGGSEEAFTPVFAPYKLVIYDGAGNKLGEHELNPTGLKDAATANREYLVSTAAANTTLGVMGDETLDVALPLAAGQACFEANPNPPAFSCLTWGTITKPVPTNMQGTGTVEGAGAANGKSDQRLSDNSVVAATPTPKAANKADGGGKTFAGVSFPKHKVMVDSKRRARIQVRCPKGSGGCSGRLKLRSFSGSPEVPRQLQVQDRRKPHEGCRREAELRRDEAPQEGGAPQRESCRLRHRRGGAALTRPRQR